MLRLASASLAWPAAMFVWGPGFVSEAHRHQCVQLLLAMKGTVRVRSRPEEEWTECGGALVRPGAVHEVQARDGMFLIAFVDAQSELGVALSRRLQGDLSCLTASQVARWQAVLGPRLGQRGVESWVKQQLPRGRGASRIHPRVNRVLKHLRGSIGISEDFSLETLAAISGLSRSRFMHAFTETVGVPLRPYILWLRVQHAACELRKGSNVTDAAHSAGFADAAHLDRTFRRMLGMTPSELALAKRSTIQVGARA